MGIFDKVKKTTISSRRTEERLYELALEEVENGEIRKGLFAKAIAKADGDKEKADGIYLNLRVQSMLDDIESEKIRLKEQALFDSANVISHEFKPKIKKRNSLWEECVELLGLKGYELHKSDSGEYLIGNKDNPIYSSKKLGDIRAEAMKLKRQI